MLIWINFIDCYTEYIKQKKPELIIALTKNPKSNIIDGNKVAVISSTKGYVEETYTAILKHSNMPMDLKVFKYTWIWCIFVSFS